MKNSNSRRRSHRIRRTNHRRSHRIRRTNRRRSHRIRRTNSKSSRRIRRRNSRRSYKKYSKILKGGADSGKNTVEVLANDAGHVINWNHLLIYFGFINDLLAGLSGEKPAHKEIPNTISRYLEDDKFKALGMKNPLRLRADAAAAEADK